MARQLESKNHTQKELVLNSHRNINGKRGKESLVQSDRTHGHRKEENLTIRRRPTLGKAREGFEADESIVEAKELDTALKVSSQFELSDDWHIDGREGGTLEKTINEDCDDAISCVPEVGQSVVDPDT